jgi:hypothetical protein
VKLVRLAALFSRKLYDSRLTPRSLAITPLLIFYAVYDLTMMLAASLCRHSSEENKR